MGQLLLFFLCNFSTFFRNVGGILVTNHFSLLLNDRYILAIQQIITHKELYTPWHHNHNNKPQSHFDWAIPHKSHHFFAVLMHALYDHPRYFKFQRKYQQHGPCFQTIFPFLMTMIFRSMKTWWYGNYIWQIQWLTFCITRKVLNGKYGASAKLFWVCRILSGLNLLIIGSIFLPNIFFVVPNIMMYYKIMSVLWCYSNSTIIICCYSL